MDKIVTAVRIAGLCAVGLGGSGGSQAPSVRTFGTFLKRLMPGLVKTKRGMAVFIGIPPVQQRSCQRERYEL
jgi:hypothetical protein